MLRDIGLPENFSELLMPFVDSHEPALAQAQGAGARSLVKSLVHVPCPPAQAAARARAERLGPRAERIGRSSKAGC
jgi:hypothetical protein